MIALDASSATGVRIAPARSVPLVLYVDAWVQGGLTGYVANLARGFRSRGYRVVCACEDSQAIGPMTQALIAAGVEIEILPALRPGLRGRYQRHSAMTAIVRRHPGCVMVLIMGWFAFGGGMTLAAAMGGAAATVRADLTGPEPPIGWRRRLAMRAKDALTDRIVVGAEENRVAFAAVMGRDPRKIDVVHTGIDLDRFRPGEARTLLRDELGVAHDELLIGTVSRLADDRKGLDQFMEMAREVACRFPKARFMLVGDGWRRPILEAFARSNGLEMRVIFTGWRSDVPGLLAAMDVFVMPSLYEGGPTSVLEAMAMGLPVVATAVGMVPEVISDSEDGLVVRPGSTAELAAAVARLAGLEELRKVLGARARERAEQQFGVDLMVDGYLGVFAAAVEGRRRT